MADLNTESLLTISQAAASLPPVNGKPVHSTTLLHWCHKGIEDVRLEHKRIGRRICTSRDALDRFFKALEAKDTAAASDARHAESA